MKMYIMNVVAVSVLCGICESLGSQSNHGRRMLRFIAGLCMIVVLVKPICSIEIGSVKDYLSGMKEAAAATNEDMAALCREEQAGSIKDSSEAYILHEAEELNLQLQVEVTVSENNPPVPELVTITGRASPYPKNKLQSIIEADIGIAKENQTWIP